MPQLCPSSQQTTSASPMLGKGAERTQEPIRGDRTRDRMIAAMLLAHLLGDFVFQPDALAAWKSRDWRGVMLHGLIVFGVTWALVWFVNPGWWAGVIFLSLSHLLIDLYAYFYLPGPVTLRRFLLDQLVHLLLIFGALGVGGYLADPTGTLTAREQELLWVALGLAFLSMPAWVLLKFVGYAAVEDSLPLFDDGSNKYVGISERLLALALLLLGQFLLLPLALLPRLLSGRPSLFGPSHRGVHAFELLGGLALVALVGAGLLFAG